MSNDVTHIPAKPEAEILAQAMSHVYERDLDWENPDDYDLLDRQELIGTAHKILETLKMSGYFLQSLDDLVLDEFK